MFLQAECIPTSMDRPKWSHYMAALLEGKRSEEFDNIKVVGWKCTGTKMKWIVPIKVFFNVWMSVLLFSLSMIYVNMVFSSQAAKTSFARFPIWNAKVLWVGLPGTCDKNCQGFMSWVTKNQSELFPWFFELDDQEPRLSCAHGFMSWMTRNQISAVPVVFWCCWPRTVILLGFCDAAVGTMKTSRRVIPGVLLKCIQFKNSGRWIYVHIGREGHVVFTTGGTLIFLCSN